jgi:beta-galactosidase
MANKQSLSFDWNFMAGYEAHYIDGLPEQSEKVDLPHTVKMLPYHYFDESSYQGLFTYEKRFDDLYPSLPTKILHFSGVMLQMQVFFNGINLGHFISGFLPVDIDISKLIKPKGNLLIVIVDTREDKTIPPFGDIVDYLTFGGIYRAVDIYAHPSSYIDSLAISADMEGHLEVKTALVNPDPSLKVSHILCREGKVVAEFLGEVYDLPSPRLWDVDDPYLYTLKTFYGDDEREDNVGFRSASFTSEGFYLNNKKVKIRGLNRHQTYPYFGAAAPASLQEDDANILKFGLGANLVRTSHYSDDESFLSHCDRIGLLLIDEIPGWQHISSDKKWRANLRDFTVRMIKKERNHPCLVAYGLRIDESKDDHELYASLESIKKEMDLGRQSIGVRNFKQSELLEDVYGYNDFACCSTEKGLDDPVTYIEGKHPILVTEHNGHMFPTKSYDAESKRREHALRHGRVLDDSYSYPNLSGTCAWCAFDYNTHKDFGSGDRICYHGLADIFRLPKPAGELYASQSLANTFYVMGNLDPGEEDGCKLQGPYIFTDAEYVDAYHGDLYVGRYYPAKDEFPHMPHPPVHVKDLLGASLKTLGYSEKECKALLLPIAQFAAQGQDSLTLKQKLTLFRILKRHNKDVGKAVEDIQNLLIGRGEKAKPYKFIGYKKGEAFASKTVSMSTSWHYELSYSKNELVNASTYDALRVSVRKLDQNGTLMAYADDTLLLETEGPVEIMGPKVVSLVGGGISVYLRSKKGKGKACLKINGESNLRLDIDVK